MMEKEHFEVLREEVRGQLQLLAEGHMALLARFDGVDARFDGVDGRLDRLQSELRAVRQDVATFGDDHEQRISKLEKRRR